MKNIRLTYLDYIILIFKDVVVFRKQTFFGNGSYLIRDIDPYGEALLKSIICNLILIPDSRFIGNFLISKKDIRVLKSNIKKHKKLECFI